MKWLGVAVVLIAVFSLGSFFGEGKTEVRTETKTVTETETVTVTEPAPPAERYIPEHCAEMLRLAPRMADASIEIDAASTRQLDLLRDAAVAIHSESITEMNAVDERQRKLQGTTVGAVDTLADLQYQFDRAAGYCEKEMQ